MKISLHCSMYLQSLKKAASVSEGPDYISELVGHQKTAGQTI